jgi:hypothetical protein
MAKKSRLRFFRIYSPTIGKRADFPNILLPNAVTLDNESVQFWEGEIRTQKLRTKELVRTTYAVSEITTSTSTVKITGSYVSLFASGATVALYNLSDDSYEDHTLSTTSTYDGTSTILTVAGTITAPTFERVFNSVNVASTDPANANFLKVGSPDSNAFIRYERFVISDGTERLVGFTEANIYYWDTAATEWNLLFTSAGTCTYWDAAQYGDYLAVTNNVDRPQYWDGNSATTFEDLDTNYATTASHISKAKFIVAWNDYILLGNIETSDGVRYQHWIACSNIGEGIAANGWRQDTGGDAGFYAIAGDGEIEGGFGIWKSLLFVFKSRSIRKLWFVGGSIPIAQDHAFQSIGCSAPGSVGNDMNEDLYFYGNDAAFHSMGKGIISAAIDSTARNINPSLLELLRFQLMDEYKEVRWAIPHGSSATANNKVVVFRPLSGENGRWETDINIAVTAFGEYSRQINYTWDTLPYESWDDWGWESWDAAEEVAGFALELCGDADGYTYLMHGGYLDNGSAYTSSFVLTTDLADKQGLPGYKRVLFMHVYVRAEASGTLSLAVKRDNETSWQDQGSVALTGNEEILRQRLAVDFRGRHFLVKGSGTSKFSFVGIEFEFIYVGER